MAFARRILTALVTAAVAFAPVGAAAAGVSAPQVRAMQTTSAPAHAANARHHDNGARLMATSQDRTGAAHCEGAASKCCRDKGACAQTCLQKCFGQLAVIAPDRTARMPVPYRLAMLPAQRPPGRSFAPQPPPPRA